MADISQTKKENGMLDPNNSPSKGPGIGNYRHFSTVGRRLKEEAVKTAARS